jgi:mono/diheme cytochrome c family protein
VRVLVILIASLAFAAPAFGGVNLVVGKTVFKTKCGSCHTLAAAGTHATSSTPGPPLTNRKMSMAKVIFEIFGNGGAMPLMADELTQTQINDVVAYVVQATKPPPKKKTK